MPLLVESISNLPVLSDPYNPSSFVSYGSQSGSPAQFANVQAGDFRSFSGDRTRLIVADQSSTTFTMTFENVSLNDRDLLFSWKGKLLLFRDSNGMKVYGAYLNPQATHYSMTNPRTCSVTLDFHSVTAQDSDFQ